MDTLLSAVWWSFISLMFAGFGLAVTSQGGPFGKALTETARDEKSSFETYLYVGGFLFLVVTIILIVFRVKGYTIAWYFLSLASLLFGLSLGVILTMDAGKKLWSAIENFESNPKILESLLINSKSNSNDEAFLSYALDAISEAVKNGKESLHSIIELAEERLIEVRNDIWMKKMEKLLMETLRKRDYRVYNAMITGDYLPSGTYNPCRHCGGSVTFITRDKRVDCVCDGECKKVLGFFPREFFDRY